MNSTQKVVSYTPAIAGLVAAACALFALRALADPDNRQGGASSRRTGLIFSEINYHPPTPQGDTLEFVELYNTEPVALDVGGYRVSGGIDYTFPDGAVIAGRGYSVIAANPAAVATFYGLADVRGPYSNRLDNRSATLRLRDRRDTILLELTYKDDGLWPVAADGAGHSLVAARPDLGEDDPDAWAASTHRYGNPGAANPAPTGALARVLINELLAHTDLPETDFIELYNSGTQTVDLGGCILTDNPATNRYTIPSPTPLAPHAFAAFDQNTLGFSLSMHGDDVFFIAPGMGDVLDAVRFPPQQNGVALGRYRDGAAEFRVLASPTPGAANGGLRATNIVINEVMYHPISGDDDNEYVELYNRGATPQDIGFWRFTDGIDYTFPSGTVVAAGAHLVVAHDAERLIARYPALNAANTLGDYKGSLSDRGERLVLARPDDPDLPDQDFIEVDAVAYTDGWGRWSDGDGSSLELIDAHADNARAMSWAASDETAKAPWTTVEHTGVLDLGNEAITELHIYYPQAGECLVDDVQVSIDGVGTCFADDFESGLGKWSFNQGNHIRSSLEPSNGYGGGQCFHVRASGKGDTRFHSGHGIWQDMWNRATALLSPTPVPGQTVTIRAKVRWQKGWPYLVFGLEGAWLEAVAEMELPAAPGTPGEPNSVAVANAGPTIDAITTAPVLPAGNEPVTVTCRVEDPDGVASVTLRYRIDPSQTTNTLAMLDDGEGADAVAADGIYSAALPGQSAGTLLAFTVAATDAAASPAQSHAPPDPLPGQFPAECLLRFGDPTPPGELGTFRVWMTQAVLTEWTTRHKRSNEPLDVTFVYGNDRAIYNAGARYRGGWRSYTAPTVSGAYSIEFPKSERLFGVSELKVDQTGQNGGDTTRQVERHGFWIADRLGLPVSHLQFVRVFVNGNDRGILHDVQTPDDDFAEAINPDDGNPQVFKLYRDRPIEPPAFTDFVTTGGVKKDAAYRWYWSKRKPAVPDDDFSPLYPLAEALATSDDTTYDARVAAVLDPQTAIGYLAATHIFGNQDSYGYTWPHNLIAYFPRDAAAQFYLYDLDMSLGRGTSATTDLFYGGDSISTRLLARPAFRRAYWRFIKQAAADPFVAGAGDTVLDAWYAAFQASGASVTSPQGIKDWIAARRTYMLSQLAGVTGTAFAVTTADFSTATTPATIQGTAPIQVTTLSVNSHAIPITWTGQTAWRAAVPLTNGVNALVITGLDADGAPLGADSIAVTLTAPAPALDGALVLNEIMYHSPDPYGGFIEIYNTTTQALHLGGIRLDGADFTFPFGSLVGPTGYVVVAESRAAYQRLYGNAEVVAGEYGGSLDNGGETLRLLQPVGTNTWLELDRVTFDDDPPWPVSADGDGPSLQLIDPARDNNRIGNWAVAPTTAAPQWQFVSVTGTVNGTPSYAKLHVYLSNAGSVLIDDVELVAGSEPGVGTNLLRLPGFEGDLTGNWTPDGNHVTSSVTNTPVHGGSGALRLAATGPGSAPARFPNSVHQDALGLSAAATYTLSYWYLPNDRSLSLTAEIAETTIATSHAIHFDPPELVLATPGAVNNVARALPEFPLLWINEVMPSNVTTWTDGAGDYDPWIELYNADTRIVALGADAYTLSDDADDVLKWSFPAGTVLAPGERLLVWADGETGESAPGEPHATFRLNGATGTVVLARNDAGQPIVLDTLTYAQPGAGYSIGSYPEGDPWSRLVFHQPTPGTPNIATSIAVTVTINEWMADNTLTVSDPADGDYDDWFELYNAGTDPVNLGGYRLSDELDKPDTFTIPGGTVIAPHAFLLVWADDETSQNVPGGELHVNFKLSKSGEAIGLFAPDGSAVDTVTFGAQVSDTSEGRWRDGDATCFMMQPPTPGAANRVLDFTALATAPAGETHLTWSAVSGAVYRIDGCNTVTGTTWQPVAVVTALTPVATFAMPHPAGLPTHFYRLRRTQ